MTLEHGFAYWAALGAFVATMPGGVTILAKPVRVVGADIAIEERVSLSTRQWPLVLEALARANATRGIQQKPRQELGADETGGPGDERGRSEWFGTCVVSLDALFPG